MKMHRNIFRPAMANLLMSHIRRTQFVQNSQKSILFLTQKSRNRNVGRGFSLAFALAFVQEGKPKGLPYMPMVKIFF